MGGIFDFSRDDDLLLRGSEQLYVLTDLLAPLRTSLIHSDLAAGTDGLDGAGHEGGVVGVGDRDPAQRHRRV